jgi:hypothetical protein
MRARLWLLVACLAVTWPGIPAVATFPASGSGVPQSALWEAPSSSRAPDLFNGPWGSQNAPDPRATYTFVRRKLHGVNPGMVVRDPAGRTWHVKQAPRGNRGAEGPVEVVLSRVLSAVGYHQPPVYFLPEFMLANASGAHVERGGRFRLDVPSLHPRGAWSWQSNPFAGTRPLEGLLAILLLFNSWDLKDSNNTLYEVRGGNQKDTWYVVRDLGGALGGSGGFTPPRNDIEKFERARYISHLSGGFVQFSYHGKQPALVHHRICAEDVQWAMTLLGALDDRQWHDAFRAGGYSVELSDRFIQKIQANIRQGQQIAGPRTASTREGR